MSHSLSDLAQENAFRRAINHATDLDLILDLRKKVDECFRKFMVCPFYVLASFRVSICSQLGTRLSTAIDVKNFRK